MIREKDPMLFAQGSVLSALTFPLLFWPKQPNCWLPGIPSKSGCAPFVLFTDYRLGPAWSKERTDRGIIPPLKEPAPMKGAKSTKTYMHRVKTSSPHAQHTQRTPAEEKVTLMLFTSQAVGLARRGTRSHWLETWRCTWKRVRKIMRRFWSLWQRLAGHLCFAVIKWHLLSFCCQTSLALGYSRENPQLGMKKPLMLQQWCLKLLFLQLLSLFFSFSLLLYSGCNGGFSWLRSLKDTLRGQLCVLADCVWCLYDPPPPPLPYLPHVVDKQLWRNFCYRWWCIAQSSHSQRPMKGLGTD